MMAMRPLSFGSPVHFGKMMAFSGCAETCSGCTSRTTTFDRSRLRYDKSYVASAPWPLSANKCLPSQALPGLSDTRHGIACKR